MSPDLRREILRKAFHFLSLIYLAAYFVLGQGLALAAIGAWIALEAWIEALRLNRPAVNEALMRFFGGIHRESEARKVSGVLWTSLGCWLTIAAFGARPGSDQVPGRCQFLSKQSCNHCFSHHSRSNKSDFFIKHLCLREHYSVNCWKIN